MNLTRRAHEWLNDNLALDDILPVQMPLYVNSVAYLFGVSTLSALGMLVLTGVILALFGPGWYHEAPAGRFFNSLHFWSVQVFFGAMILHLATKFFMAAWRDGRVATWIVGMLVFAVAIFTGLTGYLCQTNWDSQWIAVQAKDAMNAFGVGAFFNTMNTGQVLTLHVVVLPLVIAILTGIHLAQLRRDSPVRPLPEDGAQDEQTL
ncbi:MAG TPA: cytochrome b N-terminal domain-containing protein [Armatimonadota bacterium]|nr:cytochrome b N-terminal domain-containing protein [Armatimonadota bacterium]